MRGSTAVGFFLGIVGLMILALHPVYRVPREPGIRDLEAATPLEESRPIPSWVGGMAIGLGAASLLFTLRRTRGTKPNRENHT